MSDRVTMHVISSWLVNLSDLVKHGNDGRPTREKIALYTTMLAKEFPADMFTADTMREVLRGNEWWPAFETIRVRLREFQRETEPMRVALPAPRIPDRAEPTEAEHRYVRDLVAKFTAETREREQQAATKLREERGAERAVKVLSRETLTAAYEAQGLMAPMHRTHP